MYLEDTGIAPVGSWRATKIEYELILDIAATIGARREGDMYADRPYHREAERWLRMFMEKEGRYPVNFSEVEERFPGCLERIKLRLVI